MSYSPPRGRQGEIAKWILAEHKRWFNELENNINDSAPHMCFLDLQGGEWSPQFLVEGVRTNGVERIVCTVLNSYRGLRVYDQRLRKNIAESKHAQQRVFRFLQKLKKKIADAGLSVCPSCHGKKGRKPHKQPPPKKWQPWHSGPICQWQDCSRCGGTGLTELHRKPVNQLTS